MHAVVAGRLVRVARPGALDDVAPSQAAATARLVTSKLEAQGRTTVVVLVDACPVGVLAITDEIRADASRAVGRLGELTGAPAVLLTGDNSRAARAVAGEVGIAEVRASLLPTDKVAAVQELQADGTRLGLVGDGFNDAPALAAAHLGVAMGGHGHGSDLALEAADVVMVGDELGSLPAAINISRQARRVVKANLAFAAVVIAALVGLDLAGHLPLPLGVVGHEGSTVVVGLNGLRLLRRRHWRP